MSTVEATVKTLVASKYQQAINDWVTAHVAAPGALIVEAVAGSGKTTTIVGAAKFIPVHHRSVFLAFNKSIATELSAKLPSHVEAKTLNSLGNGAVFRALGRTQLDANKVRGLVDLCCDKWYAAKLGTDHRRALVSLIGKAKSHALVPAGGKYKGYEATAQRWQELVDRYDIDFGDDPEVQRAAMEMADWVLVANLEQQAIIDYDDQMYFVVAMDLQTTKYDWIIVDEAQDVAHVQRLMLQKFLSRTGRLIAVGDSRQAIYGFRGADSEALNSLATVFRASRLPLSITYRCPKAVVRAAQQYVPELEAADSAIEGVVESLRALDAAELTDADMVICRYTAPVISTAYKLIGRRIPCQVPGRDIGVGLVALIKRVAGRQWTTLDVGAFRIKLDAWRQLELDKASKKNDDAKVDSIEDKYQSLCAVADGSGATTVPALIADIESVFASTKGVKLSTVHRSKGLEADRVYILDAHCMPSKRAKQPWQMQQELNLIYVAYTRAKTALYFIDAKAVA
jgi:DNA helicase-2/ATP-dependent DNA helicase PcrA